ncbi:S8 family serine peptidase [Dactylosporangium fulvum]|uniref:S8 family serine peptidase n=1 Tax=Dactylosporangium fulvum TaxID=53359 RepID=A0ABY5VQI9_9ACTN|nr:S8 family serine peptidase [Dactylosporangium fulvum]UWP80047.1 S8 family serine peptidase [Dactylosporangium fulvum]
MRVLRVLVPLTLVAALVGGLAGGSPPALAADVAPTTRTSVVTLVTGDQVLLGERGEVSVRAGAGRERVAFATSTERGHLIVVPGDAIGLVGSGRVDRRLFDVTALREAGYDDGHAADLPLIVQYGASVSVPAAPAASRKVRSLPGARADALRAPKRTAADFWRRLANGGELNGGVAHLWLDGRRRLDLDVSVPQISAPKVWQDGYTGGGVTVAVLDSGIDATHPDLAGQVIAAQDFTGSGTVGDPVGHGTHVAATVAGTGAASGGRYRGVAPGAKLLDGRVCELAGCQESAILAGMQWAAERGARVVNISLGHADTEGVDPIEDAINRLSAQHNMLFVVAAGNGGAQKVPVSSPGTADAALSVGAVDKSDRLAAFSSRGPRPGDGAIKPDVTAPGVDIVAARSSTGTIGVPVGERYVQLSGTSMAAPHAAGAASLLMSVHPDWPASRVKAALTGSAVPLDGVSPLAQGSGRIDVAKAAAATVTSEPVSIGLGTQAWPHGDDPKLTRTVTYHNTGQQQVTLALTVDVSGPTGQPAPAGMFTLATSKLTVPAGGDAAVTLTVNTSLTGAADGWYTGRINATGGGTTVTTPLAVEREPEAYNVTLRHLGRNGKPTGQYQVAVAGYETPVDVHPYDASGTTTVRLPAGHYVFSSWIREPDGSQSLLVQPWLDLTHADATVTLDARTAKPIGMTVPSTSARMMMGVVQYHAGDGAIQGGLLADASFDGLYVANVGAPAPGRRFAATTTAHFAEPGPAGDFADSPYRYNAAFTRNGRMFDGFNRQLKAGDFVAVTQRDLQSGNANRAILGISSAPGSTPPGGFSWDYPIAAVPGAARTEYFTTGDVRWWQTYQRYRVEGEEQTPLASEYLAWQPVGAGEMRWGAPVVGPALPVERLPGATRHGDAMRFRLALYAPGLPNAGGSSPVTAARTALYRDGTLLAQSDEPGILDAIVPGAAAGYRLEVHTTRDTTPYSTSIDAAWTFSSATPPAGNRLALPLLAVRFGPRSERGSELPIWVEWQRPDGATVRQLTVDFSYDDGAHWQRANLAARAGGWVARTPAGTGAGYVSLRARATDSHGNGVEETIIRAYRTAG